MERALAVFRLTEVPAGHEGWLQESVRKVASVEQADTTDEKQQKVRELARGAGCMPDSSVESMQHWAPLSILSHSLQYSSGRVNAAEKINNVGGVGYAGPTEFYRDVAKVAGEHLQGAGSTSLYYRSYGQGLLQLL